MKHPFVEESDSEDAPEFDDLDEIEIEKFRLNIVPSLLRRNLPLSLKTNFPRRKGKYQIVLTRLFTCKEKMGVQ